MFSERNLLAAFQQVAKNDGAPGVDHVTVDEFERRLPDSIWELSDLIKSGTFQPQAIKRVEIPKPGSTEMRPLGYTFRGTKHWPRDKSRQKLKDSLRAKTKRKSGESLPSIIQKVNQSLRGWFEYFKHSSYTNVFSDEDGWLRRRLRSLLRRRIKRRGISKGIADSRRWPNLFFAKQGLFSLKQAHAAAIQSSLR